MNRLPKAEVEAVPTDVTEVADIVTLRPSEGLATVPCKGSAIAAILMLAACIISAKTNAMPTDRPPSPAAYECLPQGQDHGTTTEGCSDLNAEVAVVDFSAHANETETYDTVWYAAETLRVATDNTVRLKPVMVPPTPAARQAVELAMGGDGNGGQCVPTDDTLAPSVLATELMPELRHARYVVAITGNKSCPITYVENGKRVTDTAVGIAHLDKDRTVDIYGSAEYAVILHELLHLLHQGHDTLLDCGGDPDAIPVELLVDKILAGAAHCAYSDYNPDDENAMGSIDPNYASMNPNLILTPQQVASIERHSWLDASNLAHPDTAGEATFTAEASVYSQGRIGLILPLEHPYTFTVGQGDAAVKLTYDYIAVSVAPQKDPDIPGPDTLRVYLTTAPDSKYYSMLYVDAITVADGFAFITYQGNQAVFTKTGDTIHVKVSPCPVDKDNCVPDPTEAH